MFWHRGPLSHGFFMLLSTQGFWLGFFLAIFNLHRQLQGDETLRGNTNLKFPVASVPGQVG